MVIKNLLDSKECNDIFNHILNTPNKKKLVSENIKTGGIGETETSYGVIKDVLKEISDKVIGMNNLKDRIQKHIDVYNEKFALSHFEISNSSWFLLQKQNSFAASHIHPNSILSGTLYINANNAGHELCFENPNPFISYMSKTKETELNQHTYTVKPENGMLILFPSYIKHGAIKINKLNDRCVIAFNTKYTEI